MTADHAIGDAIRVVTARRLARSLIDGHSEKTPFQAKVALELHPELQEFDTVVLDLAYEEYCQRKEHCEVIDPDRFCAEFPRIQELLKDQLLVDMLLASGLRSQTLATSPVGVSELPTHLQLIAQLGKGTFGTVHLALDRRLRNRPIVIKSGKHIPHEATSLAMLDHPSIIPIWYTIADRELGFEANCSPYLGCCTFQEAIALLHQTEETPTNSAEFFQRLRLRHPEVVPPLPAQYSYLVPAPQSLGELIHNWARQLLEALAHAHACGVVHCDIKPSNILIGWDGRAILLDFGISQRELESAIVGGTIAYMAPEQLAAMHSSGSCSSNPSKPDVDLYALAATLYELLTGLPPAPLTRGSRNLEEWITTQIEAKQGWQLSFEATQKISHNANLDALIVASLSFNPELRPLSAPSALSLLTATQQTTVLSPRRRNYSLAKWGPIVALCALVTLGVVQALPSVNSLNAAGWTALERHDEHRALGCFQRVIERVPQEVEASLGMVFVFMNQRRFDEAFQLLNTMPQHPLMIRCKAYCLVASRQDLEEALELYRHLELMSGMNVDDRVNAAYCCVYLAKFEQAQELLSQIAHHTPHYWSCLVALDRRVRLRDGRPIDGQFLRGVILQAPESSVLYGEVSISWAIFGRAAELGGRTSEVDECLAGLDETIELAKKHQIPFSTFSPVPAIWKTAQKNPVIPRNVKPLVSILHPVSLSPMADLHRIRTAATELGATFTMAK